MKLLISSVVFVITISGLFLFENLNRNTGKESAQIDNFIYQQAVTANPVIPTILKNSSTNKTTPETNTGEDIVNNTISSPSTATPTSIPSPVKTATPSLTPRPTSLPTPAPTQIKTPTPTPLPTQTNTPNPTSTPVPTPITTPESTPEQSEKININTASHEELQKITGVGTHIAQHIIDYRNVFGSFIKIEDIKNVSHIKEATFEKMKNEVTI